MQQLCELLTSFVRREDADGSASARALPSGSCDSNDET